MTDLSSRDTDPSDLLPPDDAPTSIRPETPFELVLRELNTLTLKVDALRDLVVESVDARVAANEAINLARENSTRLDAADIRCRRLHTSNGAHHD